MNLKKNQINVKKGVAYFLLITLGLFSCDTQTPTTNTSTSPSTTYSALMVGSSGYMKVCLDNTNHNNDSMIFNFDKDSDGSYDIIFSKKGQPLDLVKGITHSDGTSIKMTIKGTDTSFIIQVPGHGSIDVLTEKQDGSYNSNVRIYEGEIGVAEFAFSVDADGVPRGNIDEAKTKAITKRAMIQKIIFNMILNSSTKKVRLLIKGLDMDFSYLGLTKDQETAMKDYVAKSAQAQMPNGFVDGTYTYDATAKTYTITIKGYPLTLKEDASTGDITFLNFSHLLAGGRMLPISESKLKVIKTTSARDSVVGQFGLGIFPGGFKFVNGVLIDGTNMKGRFFLKDSLGDADVVDIEVRDMTGQPAVDVKSIKTLADYIILRKKS